MPKKVSFALPDKFNGSAEQCKGFLRQVEIFFKHQGDDFDSDEKKCAFLMSLLTGKVIEWAAAVWGTNQLFQTPYTYFVQQDISFSEMCLNIQREGRMFQPSSCS